MPRSFRLIPKHERYAVFRLFLYCLIIAAAYTSARTVADSLFLSRIGGENLAALFVASGLVTAVVASLWVLVTRRLPLSGALRFSGVVLAAATLAVWWTLPQYHHAMWLLAGVYLLAEIRGCVNAINILPAMNEILGRNSSRYAWATVGLGVPIAGIVCGGLIGAEGQGSNGVTG